MSEGNRCRDASWRGCSRMCAPTCTRNDIGSPKPGRRESARAPYTRMRMVLDRGEFPGTWWTKLVLSPEVDTPEDPKDSQGSEGLDPPDAIVPTAQPPHLSSSDAAHRRALGSYWGGRSSPWCGRPPPGAPSSGWPVDWERGPRPAPGLGCSSRCSSGDFGGRVGQHTDDAAPRHIAGDIVRPEESQREPVSLQPRLLPAAAEGSSGHSERMVDG